MLEPTSHIYNVYIYIYVKRFHTQCMPKWLLVCVGPLRTKGACAHFHEVMTYQAVLPVQQVGAMWTVLAADEVHLFPTSVDETAIHEFS